MLYWFELKKIVKRKMVWITLLVSIVVGIFTVSSEAIGDFYMEGEKTDTNYHKLQMDREYREALTGRPISQPLLEEMCAAYAKIPADVLRYAGTEEYEKYARPYSAIFGIVTWWNEMTTDQARKWKPDEEELYAARTQRQKNVWQGYFLTEAEQNYWMEQERQLKPPFTYRSYEGYYILTRGFMTIGLAALLFASICMASVFTQEHTYRTDQLLLSSAYGRHKVYWAKLCAGITVALAGSAAMVLPAVATAFGIYGTEGFTAMAQLDLDYSYPLTMGQVCLIVYAMLFAAVVFVSVFVMTLSEIVKGNVAALAVSFGLIIAGMMVSIPKQYRAAAQIWDWLPTRFLSIWHVFDVRMIPIFGQCYVSWQIVPLLYAAAGIAIAAVGRQVYGRYQVSGR